MKIKQVNLTIDGNAVTVEEGATILQAARQVGIHIPTVCYMETLSPYGGCRICVVEIVNRKGQKPFLDTSCTHEVREGMAVDTQSPRVVRTRKMLAELLVASAPNVKIAQDIAARMDGRQGPRVFRKGHSSPSPDALPDPSGDLPPLPGVRFCLPGSHRSL